jgi:hypothetical protein
MRPLKCFFLILLLISTVTCSLKPRGWWQEGILGVMADSTEWESLQGELRNTFEHIRRTPQIEKTFTIRYIHSNEFTRYTEFRYLILLATLDSGGRIGKIVGNVVSDPEVRRRVEEGEINVFTLQDQWAKDQLMAIIVGKDIATLRQTIMSQSSFLYDIFDTDFNARMYEDMFERGWDKEQDEHLMSAYGWNIKLQRDYFLVQEISREGFVWFRRMYPERWLFVRWIEGGDPKSLSAHWVVGERNRLCAAYYGGDRVVNRYLYSQEGTFLGRPAQITSGLWENEDKVAGGPFKNYVFYDSLSRRTYMIDLAVYAPDRDKLPYLKRMEIIAKTFRTVFDPEDEDE